MKKILLAGIIFASLPFATFAQTSGTSTTPNDSVGIADPGLIPGDFFYFLDRWTEALNTTFTFNKEKKARLHLEYAKERVAEMKEVLKKPDAKLEDIKSAKENFDAQVADAAILVKSENDKGVDVAGLARDLSDELDASRVELKDVLRGHQDNAGQAETEIRTKLSALAPADPQIKGLTQALESITKEKGNAVKEGGSIDANLSDEESIFDEAMGTKMAAEKHMEQALRLRGHLEGTTAQGSEQLMMQAQEAMKRGDFDAAKRISKDAERELENAGMMRGGAGMSTTSINGIMMEEDTDVGAAHVNNLEQEIKKGENMMDSFDAEKAGNETNTINR